MKKLLGSHLLLSPFAVIEYSGKNNLRERTEITVQGYSPSWWEVEELEAFPFGKQPARMLVLSSFLFEPRGWHTPSSCLR